MTLLKRVALLALFCVAYLLIGGLIWLIIGPAESETVETSGQLLLLEILLTAVSLPFVWGCLRREGESFKDIGLVFRRGWLPALGVGSALGVGVKLAVLPVGLMASLLGAEGETPPMEFDGLFGSLAAVTGGALAGVHEEIVFRGYVRIRLAEILGDPVPGGGLARTGLITSVGFALLHGYQGVLGIVITGVVGWLFFAIATSKRYGLLHAVFAHAMFNGISFLALAAL